MNLQTASRLRDLRRARGWTQETLADMLNVPRQTISKWEAGLASPDTDKLMAMSDLYGMSVDELLTGQPQQADPVRTDPGMMRGAGTVGPREILCRDEQLEFLKKAFPILCAAAFLLLGVICGAWKYAWLVFFAIPLFYSSIPAAATRDHRKYAYPVLVTAAFLWLGLAGNHWRWCWLVFLTIPLYYMLPRKK